MSKSLVGNIKGFDEWTVDESDEEEDICYSLLELTDEGYKYVCDELTDVYERFRAKGWKEENGLAGCKVSVFLCASEINGFFLDVSAKMDGDILGFGYGHVELPVEDVKYCESLLKDDKDFAKCYGDHLGYNVESFFKDRTDIIEER